MNDDKKDNRTFNKSTNNHQIEVVIVNKDNNYKEKPQSDYSSKEYNNGYSYNHNYGNKPYNNRRNSKYKKGSLPPKKSGFNYNNYQFDENNGYYDNNGNTRNNKKY
jgi:hypothetical protein